MALLGGCETAPVVDAPAPPLPDVAPLASNELSRLGRLDLAAGNSGLAEQHFRGAVEKNGNDADAWLGLAAAYDNLKRFDLADRAYDHAIKLQGTTFEIINNLGYSYLLRGDRTRALAELQKAAAMQPNNDVVRNNILLLRSGDLPNRSANP
ncbi:hypothetical protein P7D22_11125 [Lichenihabitans sp. Uapishka_5]|uniref:tetratricopeptide repeat protein n=1 Tax=Lichenihabitans sp. Uapishka_5 TaxID=3037302 RepID=UPI0029E8077F|nr:tetratricopeptide repeat protein [Lichenihabitans sp. Uapishka_5]MDX7951719.1 hypothetical protein [Lichenihabitans sp. Uapishka_5]